MIYAIIVSMLMLFYIFNSLIINISSNLIDWYDYPLAIWIINQNITKIKSLDFINYFNTNAFYPNKYSLLFADTFIPQSIFTLPFSFLTNNIILSFNLSFILIFVLNIISIFIFWKTIFKKNIFIPFIGSLLSTFLFIHLQLGHFQMMFFWPFFLCLYFVFKNEHNNRTSNLICTGLLLSIQFLASVYIALFLITALGIFFLLSFIFSKNRILPVKNFLMILVTFLLIDGIFIKGYFDMKNNYQIRRSINEYINYSAHLTDYLFVNNDSSLLYSTGIVKKWNQLNKHFTGERAIFPGFLLTLLAVFGLFTIKKGKDSCSIKLTLDKIRLFFLLLMLVGFVFSLGPRISFNGNYAHLPTPYAFFLKLILFFESVRAPARWSYLFYIGVVYFAMNSLNSISLSKRTILTWSIFFLILAEYLPLPIKTHKEIYLTYDYEILKKICAKEKKVLLEIPVTHFFVKEGIAQGLNYITKVQLASVYHGCYLVNGYSGYDLPELLNLDMNLTNCFENHNCDQIKNQLGNMKIDIVKFNIDKIKVIPLDLLEMLSISKMPVDKSSNLYKLNH